MTFSIAARDPKTGEIGVAVATCAFAVGAAVPWAQAGVGAVATQSFTNLQYGSDGLDLLNRGLGPEAVIAKLTEPDPGRKVRQVGVLAADGRSANYTGESCVPWCGGVTGPDFTAQGNMLAGPQVVGAMVEAFTKSDAPLPGRLLAALQAGQAAGGDRRGQQSAALLVVKEGAQGRPLNLRVDDHPRPVEELSRLMAVRDEMIARFAAEWIPLPGDTLLIVQVFLRRRGLYDGDPGPLNAATLAALRRWAGEAGLSPDDVRDGAVSQRLYALLRQRFAE